ncbi:MAG: glycosyltransferase [Lachnospiraceae bacterium]|nr:glycosyltransferase [Lachnospiraceae bacterium]
MKCLTITVPCFNSQDYIKRCMDSLLVGGNDVEIIIVDDGSTDKTAEIADKYREQYPDIVKVVHKENGGHGSGVNKGLELATGMYFKVVDSDDWLDTNSYKKLINKIKMFCKKENSLEKRRLPDLFVCNYIYDHSMEGVQKPMNYRNVFPVEKICGWKNIGRFRVSQYLIMHALVFRTKILKKAGVKLPEHMFYVDNLFANQPLPYVKSIYYMDMDLYHYFLGREDQSVNEKMLIKRIDQQIYVTRLVIQSFNYKKIKKQYPKLEKYLCRNGSIMLAISSIHLLLMQTKEAKQKRRALWKEIKEYDRGLYYRFRYQMISGFTYLPGGIGDYLTLWGYKVARKIVKFQ